MTSAAPPSPKLPEQSQSRKRAAIAAQACETCRARKSKCDEQRPKCSLCRNMNYDCQYREPLPTKKDKSLQLIMASLSRLETKVNTIGEHMSLGNHHATPPYALSISPTGSSHHGESDQPVKILSRQDSPHKLLQSRIGRPHKVILWPAIHSRLRAAGVSGLDIIIHNVLGGSPWLLRLDPMRFTERTPIAPSIPTRPELPSSTAAGIPHYAEQVPELLEENLIDYSNAYFDSYNVLFPVFERKSFMENRLPVVVRRGFGYDDPDATIVLGIAALGKMVDKGLSDQDLSNGAISSASCHRQNRMPGAEIFHAFQKRVGGTAKGCAIEVVQIALLQAFYYGASGLYINAWRSVSSASQAVRMLISCTDIDWTSAVGLSISKAYWICFLLESWFSMDLDLPRIILSENFESDVPLSPSKLVSDSAEEQVNSASLTANVTLCRLSMALKHMLSRAFASDDANSASITDEQARQMQHAADQMEDWRAQLPVPLSWTDENSPVPETGNVPSPQPFRVTNAPDEPLADPDRWNLVTAQLRNKFYFMRSWIFQPYIYQALHFPEEVKPGSGDKIARCLQDILLASITMYPLRPQRILVPDLFSYSSNFLNSLLILQMIPDNTVLNSVARERLDETEHIASVRTYLSWLKDMTAIDGIAAWSWGILPKLYPGFGA